MPGDISGDGKPKKSASKTSKTSQTHPQTASGLQASKKMKGVKLKNTLTRVKGPRNPMVKAVVKKQSKGILPVQADPLLQLYLKEIQEYPVLTREEERALAVEFYEKQDRETLQKLVTSNLRFVVKIAYEYVHYRIKLLDLIQEGNMGLVKGVQEFNPYRDVRLTTYAVWWIRSYIQDAILKNYSLVKMGTTQAQKRLFYGLRREQRKLEQMGLRPAERVKLLAERFDVKEKEVNEMESRMGGSEVSLNAPLPNDAKGDYLQILADPTKPADETLGDVEQREIFGRMLKEFAGTLESRERVVFDERLISDQPLTLQDIGDKYHITKERARQIEESIKGKLRKYVEEHYPDFKLLTKHMAETVK